ncbi:MAG: PucR family transcriptional regulator ligand-binding domain-containing protein, partial [Sporomusa sp.]
MITLRDLLQISNLAEVVVLAGREGLNKEILTVAVLDAPDGPQWLKGKELILSSAYIFGDDNQCLKSFVIELIQVGASGLGIKMGRFVKELPQEIEDIANAASFTILKIPLEFVWTDIIAPFYALKYGLNNVNLPPKIEPDMITSVFLASRWGSKQLLQKLTELFALPMAIVTGNKQVTADNGLAGVDAIYQAMGNASLVPGMIDKALIQIGGAFLTIRAIPLSSGSSKQYIA